MFFEGSLAERRRAAGGCVSVVIGMNVSRALHYTRLIETVLVVVAAVHASISCILSRCVTCLRFPRIGSCPKEVVCD